MIFKPLFIINPFQHLQATLYEVVSNINYPLGPPAFVLCLCFSPNPLRNVFQQWSCILNSLNIRSRYSILLYISPSFCCSFNGLLSLKQCDFCWANFLVIMFVVFALFCRCYRHWDRSSRYFSSRPTSSSLFNRMLMTCLTSQNNCEIWYTIILIFVLLLSTKYFTFFFFFWDSLLVSLTSFNLEYLGNLL